MRKGESPSAETTKRHKQAALQGFLSKADWAIVEPYLDVELNLSARNRSSRFITLREFKQALLAGKSIPVMIQEGISKHLLGFYGIFMQGKILLTKEAFQKDYEAGLALDDMAKKYGMNREHLTYLRQLYGIKAKGATFQYRKETEVPLTQRQKEILYGSMMGDAKRMSPSSAGFGHGTFQMEYLAWKFREFASVASKGSWKETSCISKITGRVIKGWRFYTHANTDVETIIGQFYKSGRKEVTRAILENLTPLSIAVWFQDDGKTDFFHRLTNLQNHTPMPMFCTESFSIESCMEIQTWFSQKYGIRTRIRWRAKDKDGYRIIIGNKYVQKFFDLIRPYVLPMFAYKINKEANLKWREERAARYKSP